MAFRSSLGSIVLTILLFAIVTSPMLMSPSEAARMPAARELLQKKPPICPACVCCAPPPKPGTCCPCFCGTPSGPIATEHNSP